MWSGGGVRFLSADSVAPFYTVFTENVMFTLYHLTTSAPSVRLSVCLYVCVCVCV